MRRNQNDSPLLWLLPVPVVLWLAALLATEYKAGMTVSTLMGRFSWLMEHPFSVRWTPHTPKFILWALAAYGFAVALYLSTRENRRPGEEHGSAKWGSAKRLNAKYRDKDPRNNTILTQNVRMSLNGKMHRRNLLQIVIGGSGAGKTRFFVKPNLMEANCSFLVTDPKGETLRAVAPLLLQKGYVIKVFDLIDPSHSDSFNALAYIKDDTALNVVLETIQNRVAANRLAGRYTWVFVDEVYLFFKYYYSAQFLYKCWKRFRKYAAAMTAATQNIEECLRSETARLMLANSEFLILLNQAATDRAELAKLLHISETQMSHVTNVEAGHGLMRIGSSIIPFVNEFPRDGTLYRLMTTTPGDK